MSRRADRTRILPAEARLAAFDGLLRHSTDFILLLDGAGRILEGGRAFTAAFAAGPPRGRPLSRYLDRGSLAKARAALERLRGGPQAVELDLVTPEGEARLVHFSFCRTAGPEGEAVIVALGRDQEPALAFAERCVRLNRELEAARGDLVRQAETDPLTGLGNRRWLFGRLEELWATAARRGRLAWGMVADLDHFKRINDAHGHEAGDEALRAAAGALRGTIREGDLVARYGGEEFVLVGEADGPELVRALAQRLLEAVRSRRVESYGESFGMTMSLGVAVAGPVPRVPTWSILQAADRAVYRAKAGGRDRAEFAAIDPGLADGPPGPGTQPTVRLMAIA